MDAVKNVPKLKIVFEILDTYLIDTILKDVLNDDLEPDRPRVAVESGPFMLLLDAERNPITAILVKIDGRLIEYQLFKQADGDFRIGKIVGDKFEERAFALNSTLWTNIIDIYSYSTNK